MTNQRAILTGGAIAGIAAVTAFVVASNGGRAGATGSAAASATATVTRTTLASQEQVAGTLERARTYTLVSQAAGTVTELPASGTEIARGQVLYRLDGQPVRLLYGTQAAWRALALGIASGADVLQLKRNLKALGFTAGGALRLNDDFDWATAVAIEQWQRAQGVAQTGVIPLGSVAFLPGAGRVTSQLALPGTVAQPGTQLLNLSSNDLAVSIPLDPSLRQLVHVGDRVQIQLPEGQTTPGRVIQIAADATAPTGQSTSADSASSSGGPTESGSGPTTTAGSGPPPTVPVIVSLERPGDARGLDQVPVEVSITDTVHRDVLAVPITALVALAGGGYAVAVDDRGRRALIGVTPGIFDGNLVEVTSSRLQPGMHVEVPSS